MRRLAFSACAAMCLGTAGASLGALSASVTGTYDENLSNANTVNTNAAGNNVDVSTFTTNVANAWASDTGGVIDFETVMYSEGEVPAVFGATTISAAYGVSGTNILSLTNSGGVAPTNWNDYTQGTFPVLSGTRGLGGLYNGNNVYIPNVGLTAFGVTVLSLGLGDGTTSFQVYYDTAAPGLDYGLSPDIVFPAELVSASGDNTFFGWEAPTGQVISRVDVVGDFYILQDDIGFIVAVPEPAAFWMLGVGLTAAALRRQRGWY